MLHDSQFIELCKPKHWKEYGSVDKRQIQKEEGAKKKNEKYRADESDKETEDEAEK